MGVFRRGWAGYALAAVGLVGVGVCAGLAISSSVVDGTPPDVARPSTVLVDVPLTQINDALQMPLTVVAAKRDPLIVNASGRVTRVDCLPGTAVGSGAAIGSVDGRSVRLLATSVPLWRDLQAGDAGSDVSAVQAELRRLGFSASTSGQVDSSTSTAIRSWLGESWKGLNGGTVLPLAAVVWSPSTSVTPVTCDLRLGALVTAGDPALTPMPEVTQIAVSAAASATPGHLHTLTLGSVTVTLPPSGIVTDPHDLAALVSTREFAAWLADTSDRKELNGTIALDAPITVGIVPPAAVIDVASSSPCLIDPDGHVVPVAVVSSRLGLTLVAPTQAGVSLPTRATVDLTGRRTCASN